MIHVLRRWTFITLTALFALGQGMIAVNSARSEPVSFVDTIAPLFQNRCLHCHNEVLNEGGLSLTTAADLWDGGYVEPDDPDASSLIALVTPHGNRAEMPKQERPLSQDQIAALTQWIRDGANWPAEVVLAERAVSDLDWWSLRPIVDSPVPVDATATNPVDHFLQAGHESKTLSPVGTAAPELLVRRLYYDLTGLPPAREEVARFEAEWERDPEPAWLDLVDRVLASSAFGEKLAHHWLDLARYAETHGYDKDQLRVNAWPYRDYVIASFNADKPYTRFVQEQVAGDVLFPGQPDGIVGLGFLAAGPWDLIGHVEVGEGKQDGRIAKHLDRDEMLAACFNVFMSTTIQCAQCHNHKFDPLTMEDYYQGQAIFAAVDRADRIYTGLSTVQEVTKRALVVELAELNSESQRLRTEAENRLAPLVGDIDRRIDALQAQFGQPAPAQHGYHSQISSSAADEKWIQVDFGQPVAITQIRIRAAFDDFNGIGAGFGFPVRYRVEGSLDPDFQDESVRLLHDATTEDQPNPGLEPVEIPLDETPMQYLRVTATQLAARQNDFIFAVAELEFDLDSDVEPAFTSLDSIESGERWRLDNLNDGIFHQELSESVAQKELWKLQRQRKQFVDQAHDTQAAERQAEIQIRSSALALELEKTPAGESVYAAATQFSSAGQFHATAGVPRTVRLLHRGDISSPGEVMSPEGPLLWSNATASFSSVQPQDERSARAALAMYLSSPENPLVWRTIANRLWQWTFGQPLAGTPNDFGRMGMLPSHPELLDYLAARLRDDPNQSMKSIIRLLVTSQAYRRSTGVHVRDCNS